MLGISFDTVAENAAFVEKFSFDFPLLCDTDRSVGLAYGACQEGESGNAKRISYWIDRDGVIKKAYPKVDAKSHPEQVLASIES